MSGKMEILILIILCVYMFFVTSLAANQAKFDKRLKYIENIFDNSQPN